MRYQGDSEFIRIEVAIPMDRLLQAKECAKEIDASLRRYGMRLRGCEEGPIIRDDEMELLLDSGNGWQSIPQWKTVRRE